MPLLAVGKYVHVPTRTEMNYSSSKLLMKCPVKDLIYNTLATKWRQLASETWVPTAEQQSAICVGQCGTVNATRKLGAETGF